MDSDDEMVALLLEDEQAFDDDLREHLLIIASLQDMLDAEAEKRKRPRRGGSRPGRRKSKPRQRMEGHAMLHNDYFADGATHADNFRRRYRMSKGLFMNILHGVREFDPLLQAQGRRCRRSRVLVHSEVHRRHEDACIRSTCRYTGRLPSHE
nr:uncharacterized protein LOC127309140 [Lolium perenne]